MPELRYFLYGKPVFEKGLVDCGHFAFCDYIFGHLLQLSQLERQHLRVRLLLVLVHCATMGLGCQMMLEQLIELRKCLFHLRHNY